MKKNISINIGGVIFHIEEDGFDRLKNYLESINTYFSNYEDSKEIISDIENRIAEIFLAKLKEGKQVVSFEDVEALIMTMGSISDFEAIEEDDSSQDTQSESSEESEEDNGESRKSLYRDTQRKLVGGVAAGIAYYFRIDPIWIRLVLALLFFNYFFKFPITATTLLAYIIMWIVVPGRDDLKGDKKVRKLYRDPKKRVFGGVSYGLAAYFGMDVILVRLLFLILIIPGGIGIVIYVILWIITPTAKTITEKMEMEGKPITLQNIETKIKSSLNVEEGDEPTWVRVLLFPFRLIATALQGLAPLFYFLVEVLRILGGVIITIVGLALSLSFILGLFAGLGLQFIPETGIIDEFPMHLVEGIIPVFAWIVCFIILFLPSLVITLLGISIIARKMLIRPLAGWIIFAIWFLAIAVGSIMIPSVVWQFKEEGEHRKREVFDLDQKTAILTLQDASYEGYGKPKLRLRGHADSTWVLEQTFTARGRTQAQAIENASMIDYAIEKVDSVIQFDSKINLDRAQNFRVQELALTLYIPYGQPFVMDYSLREILRNTISIRGYRSSQMDGNNVWQMDTTGITCLTCSPIAKRRIEKKSVKSFDKKTSKGEYVETRELSDFNSISASGLIKVNVIQSPDFHVELKGTQKGVERMETKVRSNTLLISHEDRGYRFWFWGKEKDYDVQVDIYMPYLESVKLSGASSSYIEADGNPIRLNFSGASEASVVYQGPDLNVSCSGASHIRLDGAAEVFEIKASGASKIEAESFQVQNAYLSLSGASNARVHVENVLKVKASGGSNVRYSGNPNTELKESGGANIRSIQ